MKCSGSYFQWYENSNRDFRGYSASQADALSKRNRYSNKVPVQDIDMGQSAEQTALYKQYGRNFNDLHDFSEKAVIGTFAGAGVLMTGGSIMIVYGGVEGTAAAVMGTKAAPILVKAIVAACFVKGTQVLTNKGLQNIEEIKVNDLVSAYDIKNGKTVTKKVLTLFEREVKRLIKLEYGNEIIYTTPEHPFYINNNWVKASDLKVGDLLFLHDKSNLSLQRISVIDTAVKVYNFTVEDVHNYYVGKNKVLVHNNCGEVVKLTAGGIKKIGNLAHMKDLSIVQGVIARGGKIGNLKVISSDLLSKSVGELANMAAQGHEGAETAIKILKQAASKAAKY